MPSEGAKSGESAILGQSVLASCDGHLTIGQGMTWKLHSGDRFACVGSRELCAGRVGVIAGFSFLARLSCLQSMWFRHLMLSTDEGGRNQQLAKARTSGLLAPPRRAKVRAMTDRTASEFSETETHSTTLSGNCAWPRRYILSCSSYGPSVPADANLFFPLRHR